MSMVLETSIMTKSPSTTVTTDHTALGWIVVLSASLFFFYEFIQLTLFSAINVQLMQAFHLNAPQLGQLSSMYFYTNAIFIFPAGILLDRYSTKKLILAAAILSTLGTLAFGMAHTYFVAAAGRAVVGVGAAFCFLSCIRLASRWFPPSKMALVTGIVVTMAMLGGLVSQTPFALLSNYMGWRNAVMVDVVLGVIITLIVAFFVQDRPPNGHEAMHADKAHLKSLGIWRSIGLVLLNKQNWYGGLYTSLLNLPVFVLGALYGIHYLVQVHHLTEVQGSYATTMFFVGVIFGSPIFGWVSDHIGRRTLPMIIGAILSLIVILALMFIPELSLSLSIFLFFLIGFTTSSQVLSYPAIAELNPTALTSTAVSIASVSIMLSGVIVQPLFGWLMELNWNGAVVDGLSVYTADDFLNAMMIFPASFVIGLVIAWLMKETFCKSQA